MAIEGTHALWADLAVDRPAPGKKTVTVFGVPFDGMASARKGAALAPSALREWSRHLTPFTEDRTDLRVLQVVDMGDVTVLDPITDYSKIEKLVSGMATPIFAVGGDHSISIPILRGLLQQRPKMGLLWIDAHPDMCDFFDGSELSHACVLKRALDVGLDPKRVAMVGLRSWEEQELPILDRGEVLSISAAQVADLGIKTFLPGILERFGDCDGIYISCDIDALDPSIAPGTGIPDHGGMTMRDVLGLVKAMQPFELLGFDIVEVAPPIDPSNSTVFAALKIAMEVLGVLARQK